MLFQLLWGARTAESIDFVWLRTLLKARYEGMLIPAIPAKLLGNASVALCEPRKRLFTQFLARLGFDPLLRQDPAFFAFISVSDDAVLEDAALFARRCLSCWSRLFLRARSIWLCSNGRAPSIFYGWLVAVLLLFISCALIRRG
jgi:hypothetical protein